MKDLIERLEKATGPDRDLDDRIAIASGYKVACVGNAAATDIGFIYPDGSRHWGAPRFTESLDAALTLVPEGMAWTLGQNVHHRYWQATVNNLDEDGRPQAVGYSGLQGNRTAPIALCIAALKALDAAKRDLTKMEASNG
jgi:hypothetical protein